MEYVRDIIFIISKVLELCGSLLLLISSFKKITEKDVSRVFGFGEFVPVKDILDGIITKGDCKKAVDNYIKNIIYTRFSFVYIFVGFFLDMYGRNKTFSLYIISISVFSGLIILSFITYIIALIGKNLIFRNLINENKKQNK